MGCMAIFFGKGFTAGRRVFRRKGGGAVGWKGNLIGVGVGEALVPDENVVFILAVEEINFPAVLGLYYTWPGSRRNE